MDDLVPYLDDLGKGRSYQQGLKLFTDLVCGKCHSFGRHSQGGGYAPDLTPVATKLTRDILVREIVDPSFEIDDRFYATVLVLKDGKRVEGTILDTADGKYTVAPALLSLRTTIEVNAADIVSQEPSTVSQMPAGLLNGSTREQILDLLAFLESGGEPDAAVFRK